MSPSILSVEMCEAESWCTRSWLNRLVFCSINTAKDLIWSRQRSQRCQECRSPVPPSR